MTRLVSIIICLLFFLQIKAQDSTSFYLQKVVLEMEKNFQGIKGPLIENDSAKGETYHSIVTIPGTLRNSISIDKWGYYYFSMIEDSLRQNQAERIVRKWYEIIESSIGTGFKIIKLTQQNNIMKTYKYGWMFDKQDYSIHISSSQSILNPNIYIVSLQFINPRPQYD